MTHHSLISSRFARLDEPLQALSCLIAVAAANQAALAQVHADQQAELDSALSTVRTALGGVTDGPGFHVINQSPDVLSLLVARAQVHPNQPRDVNVTVKASAQVAALFLSFGTPSVIAPGSAFVIEIAGPGGMVQIPANEGRSINQVVSACILAGSTLGFSASLSGTGIRLSTPTLGSDAFVSVRILSTIHRPRFFSGIYRMSPGDSARADRASVVRFATPAALIPQVDFGQDVRASIDNRIAFTHGADIALHEWDLDTAMRLSIGHATGTVNAQTLGTFRAFTLVRD